MTARIECIKEKHVNLKANNFNIMRFKKPSYFSRIIKYMFNPDVPDNLKKSYRIHFDNKNNIVEFRIRDTKEKLKITWEFRTAPDKHAPNRQQEQFVLYRNGREVCFQTSQEKMIDYISKNILGEDKRTDKSHEII